MQHGSPSRSFDLTTPLKQRSIDLYPDTEDTQLTTFLEAAIEEVLSYSETPPGCPHCGSRVTALAARARARQQPVFMCNGCRRQFNRRTGTALARLTRRDALMPFIRLLSWQAPYQVAVQRLEVDERIISAWVAKFRRWTLDLDPTGRMEARIRLGVRPPPANAECPACQCARPKQLAGYAKRRLGQARKMRQARCPSCGFIFPIRTQDAIWAEVASDAPTYHYSQVGAEAISSPVKNAEFARNACVLADLK